MPEQDDAPAVTALPPEVMKRVEALSALQEQHEAKAAEYLEERKALERKYLTAYEALYKQRSAIIAGAVDPAAGVGGADAVKGIPGFWLQALQSHRRVDEFIEEQDEDALTYLEDVSVETAADFSTFTLTFSFRANPYFSNAKLVKTFHVSNLVSAASANGVELEKSVGCDIAWKDGKNLTVKTVKKTVKKGKGRPKTVTKEEPVPSFFRFFDTVELPTSEEEMEGIEESEMMAMYEQVQSEAGVGFALRNKIIPNAVNWFLGEAEDDEDEDDEDDEDYDDEDGEDEEDDEDEAPELDEDEEEEEAPKARGRGGRGGKGGKGGKPKARGGGDDEEEGEDDGATAAALAAAFQKQAGTGGGADGEKPPECKQQ